MRSEQTDEQSVRIDCPVCGKHRTAATARDLRQMLLLFHVIPIFYHRPTLVECSCGASLISRRKARDIAKADAALDGAFLSVRISPVLKTLVLGGMIAWILPVMGTLWLGIAYAWSRRYSGWIRSLALVLFILSLLPTGILLFAD